MVKLRLVAARHSRLLGLLILILSISIRADGQDPLHTLSLSGGSEAFGSVVVSELTYFSTDSSPTLGLQCGVTHRPSELSFVEAVAHAELSALNPEFLSIQYWAFGWTAQVTFSRDSSQSLPAGSTVTLFRASYRIAEHCSDDPPRLTFTSELGFPAISVQVETTAGVITPAQIPAAFDVLAESNFRFLAPLATVQPDLPLVVDILISDDTPGGPVQVDGFSMGLSHDPSVVQVVAVEFYEYLDIPSLFSQAVIYEDGWTAVYVTSICCSIVLPSPQPVLRVTYEATTEVDQATSALEWVEYFGDIPVGNVVVTYGSSARACGGVGSIAVDNGYGFRRGDCNGDLAIDVSDPITLLGRLFGGDGSNPCAEADDVNDDQRIDVADVVYLVNHLLFTGPEPLFPSAECARASAELGCEDETCP